MTSNNYKQLGTSHLLLSVISLAQWAKFRLLQVIKKVWFCWHWTGGSRDTRRLCSNEGMFQAFAMVWQTAQNGRLHKTGGTYYQSCLYPTSSAWPAFLMPFLLLLPVSGHLSRGFTVPPTKRAFSALYPQALTECSALDFRRSSINYLLVLFSSSTLWPKISLIVTSKSQHVTDVKDRMTYIHETKLAERHAEYNNTMCRCTRLHT